MRGERAERPFRPGLKTRPAKIFQRLPAWALIAPTPFPRSLIRLLRRMSLPCVSLPAKNFPDDARCAVGSGAPGVVTRRMEGWLSGLRHLTRNQACGKLHRGFKSLPFRHCSWRAGFMVMEEKTLWRGSSAAVINLGAYALSLLVAAGLVAGLLLVPQAPRLAWLALLLPVFFALARKLANQCRVYEVTTERIKLTTGLLTKCTEELELYRVKDTALVEPLLARLFSAGHLVVTTNDASSPSMTLEAVPQAAALREEIRKCVEACRDRKRVRVSELE